MDEPADRRPEPEIIPPDVPLRGGPNAWMSSDTRGSRYVYVARIGPVGRRC